jgi:AcrR family transcriptional regulator
MHDSRLFVSLAHVPTIWYVSMVMAKLDHRQALVKAKTAGRGSSREQLLRAAARVFSRRGYSGASINEIAAQAGFSKGALYWNFASKEDLFFALLDEHIDRRLRALFDLTESEPSGRETAGQISRGLSAVLEQQREMVLLFHEYSAMVARDPKLRGKYVERNAHLRDRIARGIETRLEGLGVPLEIPAQKLATALIALADGLSIEQIIDPDAVSDDLFGEALSLIFDGLKARAKGCI